MTTEAGGRKEIVFCEGGREFKIKEKETIYLLFIKFKIVEYLLVVLSIYLCGVIITLQNKKQTYSLLLIFRSGPPG